MNRWFLILFGILWCLPAFGSSITISGSVSGTWSADTVFVAGQVQVPSDSSLLILPGVKVLFTVPAKFIVNSNAVLEAVGLENDSVRFDGYPSGNSWNGIRFLSASDSSRLQYCSLRHGLATGSGDDQNGGAVFCSNSNPVITHCLITTCTAGAGGGIYCSAGTHPHISYNTIINNAANGGYPGANGGGISAAGNSYPEIDHNYLTDNQANLNNDGYGGGIYFEGSPNLHDNLITGNHAWAGGGFQGSNATNVILRQNRIDGNTALVGGGLDCIGCTFSAFELNEICHNVATSQAGALFFNSTSPIMNKNTIADNNAGFVGGLYLFAFSRPQLNNCIVWGNSGGAFYLAGNSSATVIYSDVQGGWTGTGNVESDPLFINDAQNDFRLNWGTLCINNGDPNPIYNDPDGTRADMGAYYFDFSHPVRVALTPFSAPIQIPGGGGAFTFGIELSNTTFSSHLTTVAINITLPSGANYGPVLGPITVNVAGVSTLIRFRNQSVPGSAPAGQYLYYAYAAVGTDTSHDSFLFTKQGSGVLSARTPSEGLGSGGWTNTGEDFPTENTVAGEIQPSLYSLHPCVPNPFNPTTAISYQLPANSHVSLNVYDTAGRLVTTLVEGWREAGTHEVTFDPVGAGGSRLASGLYFAKLEVAASGSEATPTTVVQKMMLIK